MVVWSIFQLGLHIFALMLDHKFFKVKIRPYFSVPQEEKICGSTRLKCLLTV